MQENSQLPNWFAWVQLLTPALIAFIALIITAWIQVGQKTISKNKLKLDLFERRYRVLKQVREISSITLSNDPKYFEKVASIYHGFMETKLLFPERLEKQINEFMNLCDEAWVDYQQTRELSPGTQEGAKAGKRFLERRREIRNKAGVLIQAIEEFIRIDWKG